MNQTQAYFLIGAMIGFTLVGIMIYLSANAPPVTAERARLLQEFYDMCCQGKACTDTLYDNRTDECVLTLCAQRLSNDKGCRYKADHSFKSNTTAQVVRE